MDNSLFKFDPSDFVVTNSGLLIPSGALAARESKSWESLQKLQAEGRFAEAFDIGLQMLPDLASPKHQADLALILARLKINQNEFDAALSYVEFSASICEKQSLTGALEEILRKTTQAEIFLNQAKVDDGFRILDEAIELCEKRSVAHIHIPVIQKSLFLLKFKLYDQVERVLTKYLPLMKETPGIPFRDEIRHIWTEIAQNHVDGSASVVRLILSSEVADLLTVSETPNFEPSVPRGWSSDMLSNFLQTAENNSLLSFCDFPIQFKLLANIEARLRLTVIKSKEIVLASAFLREGKDFEFSNVKSTDWLETFFVMRTHSAFLGAVRLALSGQFAETYSVLRTAIENAEYCFAVVAKPTWKQVWLDKYKDSDCKGKFSKRFTIENIARYMNELNPNLSASCGRVYQDTIDLGSHPNERTLDALANVQADESSLSISVATLHPDLTPRLLDATVEAGILLLEIIALALPSCTAAAPSTHVSNEALKNRAYERWCNRGHVHGFDELDWLIAESEMRLLSM